MQIELKAPKVWLANGPVDFRKSINGLREIVATQLNRKLESHIYVFYNSAKNKLKILAYHRNGFMLIYKQLDQKKFTLKADQTSLYEINQQQLSWLLAGLDWVDMSEFKELAYDDYF